MSDERPPSLVSLPGGKKQRSRDGKPKGSGKHVTVELYEAMSNWWVQSNRSPYAMARRFGVSASTAEKIVHKGYPHRNLPALKEAAADYDKHLMGAEAPDVVSENNDLRREANEWSKTKRTNITAIRNTRGLIALVQNELIARWRHSKDPTKRPMQDVTPHDMRAMVGVVKAMAGALKDLGEEERRWMHGAAPEPQADESSNPFADLTSEQLDFIKQNGRLPPGLDPAKFYSNLHLAGAAGPPAG